MNIVPRKVTVPLGIAAVVLCAVIAPIQWSQGNTTGAIFLGVLAALSLGGLLSALRRQPASPVASTAQPAPAGALQTSESTATAPAEDPRWHVETLADHLPDPADRRKVLRWFLAIAIVCLLAVIACCVATGISGDLTFMALAVMFAVPALALLYAVGRNRADL